MMRTRTYIGLSVALAALALGVVAITLWNQRDAADQPEEPTAVDGQFVPAEVDERSSPAQPDSRSVEETATKADDPVEQDRRQVPTEVVVTRETARHEPLEVGQSNGRGKREDWDTAVIQVVTNFEKADVTINGLPYPEYTESDEPEGMVLPAGGPHIVRVTYEGKTKTKKVYLQADETLIMMFELSGMKGGSGSRRQPNPDPRAKRKRNNKEKKDEKKKEGRVTVYSKPNGEIIIDGKSTNEKTPGTVEVEPGRHTVQVKFDSGEESEKKIIRVRKGSRIKLFFRKRSGD